MTALPSGALLFDTGIYIRFIRKERYSWLGEDAQIFQRTVLTAVVAAELYAGTGSQREKRALDELCRAHRALEHFSVPTGSSWTETGAALRRARTLHGQIEFVQHFRDVMIALEAVRNGATLVTENVTDFERWKTVLGASGKRLKVFRPS